MNPNAWKAGKEYMQHTQVDVVCVQETKVHGKDAIAAAEAAARCKGWRACLSPAELTAAGRPTGGIAVACRATVGMITDVMGKGLVERERMKIPWHQNGNAVCPALHVCLRIAST